MRALIFSNIFVALAAVALTAQTTYVLGAPAISGALLGLVFFATLFIYNLDRLVSASSEDSVELSVRHRWIRAHQTLLRVLAASAAIAAAVCLCFVSRDVLWSLVPLGVISLAYSLPVIGGQQTRRRLKDLPGLKIFLIAVVWGAVTVLLPVLDAGLEWRTVNFALTLVERMIFIFAITLPFDLRDLERDRRSDIETLPMHLGASRTRWLAVGLAVIFCALAIVHYNSSLQSPALPMLVSGVLTAGVLYFSDRVRGELYYVGLLDGLMIVQAVVVVGYLEWLV